MLKAYVDKHVAHNDGKQGGGWSMTIPPFYIQRISGNRHFFVTPLTPGAHPFLLFLAFGVAHVLLPARRGFRGLQLF